jgi:anti-anti-sigma regulatory factor
MASNFNINIGWNVDRIHLRLYGDFDGSSAHELLDLLGKICQSDNKILIYTQGLNHVNPFGLNIFHKNLRAINDGAKEIVYSGDLAPDFTIPYAHASL